MWVLQRCRTELGVVLTTPTVSVVLTPERAHWGKGVAIAALKRTVAAVFGDLKGVECVEADVDNAASRRALKKAGFQRQAVLRGYCVVKGRLRDMGIYNIISAAARALPRASLREPRCDRSPWPPLAGHRSSTRASSVEGAPHEGALPQLCAMPPRQRGGGRRLVGCETGGGKDNVRRLD
jgi:hypothetical protein